VTIQENVLPVAQHAMYAGKKEMMMSKELQEALDKAALAVQPILDEMLKEIEEDEL
jgi:hypothetical protein